MPGKPRADVIPHLNPLNDLLFKRIFAVPENADVLISLLNAIFAGEPPGPIDSVEPMDRNLDPWHNDDKSSRLDLLVRTRDGATVNVEVQVRPSADLEQRSLFYRSGVHHGQIQAGQPYSALKPTVVIVLLGRAVLPGEDPHHVFEVRDRATGERFFPELRIDWLEVPKIMKLLRQPSDSLTRWLLFLAGADDEHLEEIAMTEPMIKKALTCAEMFMQSTENRVAYILREMNQADAERELAGAHLRGQTEGRKQGLAEGRAQGIEEGRQAALREMAERMHAAGMDEAAVAELVGKQEGSADGV